MSGYHRSRSQYVLCYLALFVAFCSEQNRELLRHTAPVGLRIYAIADSNRVTLHEYVTGDTVATLVTSPCNRVSSFRLLSAAEQAICGVHACLQAACEAMVGVERLDADSAARHVWIDSTPSHIQKDTWIVSVSVSPEEEHAAFIARYYDEYDDLRLLDLATGTTRSYHIASMDHQFLELLVWDPQGEAFYVTDRYNLYRCDVAGGFEVLPTPNIRDFLTTDELLAQGYLGSRIDYELHLGTAQPSGISWSPDGLHCLHIRNDTLLLYSLADRVEESLCALGSENAAFDALWSDATLAPGTEWRYFTNHDLQGIFGPSMLDSISPLNTDIAFVADSSTGVASILWISWSPRQLDQYADSTGVTFCGDMSAEKCHIAEVGAMHRLMVHGVDEAVFGSPPYWWTRYAIDTTWTHDSVETHSLQHAANFGVFLQLYRGMLYPSALERHRAAIETAVDMTYRFFKCMAKYVALQNDENLRDSLNSVFAGFPGETMHSALDTLAQSGTDDRYRYRRFYAALHNSYLNYYGRVIVPIVDSAFTANCICR